MIRIITLCGARQGFRALEPFVFEIWTQTCFSEPEEGQNFEIFNVLNFAMLGVYIGVFEPAESIPDVYFTIGRLVFEIMGQNLFLNPSRAKNFIVSKFRLMPL